MIKFFAPIAVAVLVLLGLGAFIYHDATPASDDEEMAMENASTTTEVFNTEFGDITAEVSGEGKAAISVSSAPAGPPAPSLDRPFTPPSDLTPEMKVEMQKTYSLIVSTIRENSQDVGAWLELGTYRSNAGDYEGAIQAWTYVTQIAPSIHIAYANLGNVYEFHQVDYAKAEANYLKALKANPKYLPAYRSLLDLYQYRYQQNSAKAEGILLEGIAANPGETDLLVALAQLYRDEGKVDQARGRFEEARTIAEAAGNTTLVAAIDAELTALQ